jgi:hypothetical protein
MWRGLWWRTWRAWLSRVFQTPAVCVTQTASVWLPFSLFPPFEEGKVSLPFQPWPALAWLQPDRSVAYSENRRKRPILRLAVLAQPRRGKCSVFWTVLARDPPR